MEKRKLGTEGLGVSAIGLGCMGMSEFYGETNDNESLNVLHRSLELGVNFWDTSDMYGPFKNEELIAKALKGKRSQIVLATKFGIVRDLQTGARSINGSPEYVKEAYEASLKRLQTDYIDLYYQHRVDVNTPIEDTIGAMADLVKEGKVKYIGMSEAAPNTIRRAHSVHPISALQTEYSLWTRDAEPEIIPALRELGIGFVPYSPLGRGFLTGKINSADDLSEGDFRRNTPRFQKENFDKNMKLVSRVKLMAQEREVTAGQIALAWVLSKGNDFVPIPGTKRIKYIEENAASVKVKLSDDEIKKLDEVFHHGSAAGLRYPEAAMKTINL